MTRIISGVAGSLALVVPETGTRPTSDRVRESLFSSLDAADLVSRAAVLDLYAGSGALGLEAVSRGARSADLVEKSPKAATVIARNVRGVAKAAPDTRVRVHAQSVEAFLRGSREAFDLVFIDPPYDVTEEEISAVLAALVPRLAPGATVVVERAKRSPEPGWPEALTAEREKNYGDTTLWWATAP